MIKRAVERGQTVAASLQAPELFVIAQNLRDMQVEASIDESDIGRIRPGQKATFTVDAFPGQTFEGEIRQVRKAAQNTANVVTYIAVVGFSNASGRLLPGMTANVRVVTDARESVLKVPNAALRVRLPGLEVRAPARAVLTRGTARPGWMALAAPEQVHGLARGQYLLVEGGAQTAAAFLKAGLVDRLLLYRAPILIGGGRACLGDIGLARLEAAHDQWQHRDRRLLGKDQLDVYERV